MLSEFDNHINQYKNEKCVLILVLMENALREQKNKSNYLSAT